MTERFTETISTMTVTDNQTGREYKCEMGIDTDLLELLNMLHEENQQFRTALKELQEIGDYQQGRITELDKENQSLTEQLRNLRRLVNEVYMEDSK